jgi:hypothetical protein
MLLAALVVLAGLGAGREAFAATTDPYLVEGDGVDAWGNAFSFSAIGRGSNVTSGYFELDRPGTLTDFSGTVTCIRVSGRSALLMGTLAPNSLGDTRFAVEMKDNGVNLTNPQDRLAWETGETYTFRCSSWSPLAGNNCRLGCRDLRSGDLRIGYLTSQ